MGEREKKTDIFHSTLSHFGAIRPTTSRWTSLPHLLDPRALLGSSSLALLPLLHLLFPRNLTIYLEVSSK